MSYPTLSTRVNEIWRSCPVITEGLALWVITLPGTKPTDWVHTGILRHCPFPSATGFKTAGWPLVFETEQSAQAALSTYGLASDPRAIVTQTSHRQLDKAYVAWVVFAWSKVRTYKMPERVKHTPAEIAALGPAYWH